MKIEVLLVLNVAISLASPPQTTTGLLHCICLCDAGFLCRYKAGSFNKLLSCYNKCFKMFYGFKRRDSVTQILFDLGLPSFNTIMHMHNSKVVSQKCRVQKFDELSLIHI